MSSTSPPHITASTTTATSSQNLPSTTTHQNIPQSTASAVSNVQPPSTTNPTSFLTTYYPIFIAIVLCLLFLLGVTYKMRRRQKKLIANYMSNRRQQALAQDVDSMMYPLDPTMPAARPGQSGAGVTASPTHGRWYNPSNYLRRHDAMEGLDEHGMAPPPYKSGQAGIDAASGTDGVEIVRTPHEDIPLRNMVRTSKPPEYGEVIRELSGEHEAERNARR